MEQNPDQPIVAVTGQALGNSFAMLRRDRKLSQEQVAGLAKVGRNTVYRMERGLVVRIDVLSRVAEVLGMPLSRIMKHAEKSSADALRGQVA